MATINGTPGNDIRNGTALPDTLNGLAGDDTLNGGWGNDRVYGGDGNDRLIGALDNDLLHGGLGDDVLIGATGNDRIEGGGGVDTAAYSGVSAGYRLQWLTGTVRVVDVAMRDGNMGTDTLTRVSTLSFADASLTLNNAYAEFRVNTTFAGSQDGQTVAALADGSFVVSWTSNDTDSHGVFAQRYSQSGAALGIEFQVNTEVADSQSEPSITALADGGFLVSWGSFNQDTDDSGVYAQRYDASGAEVGTEFRANTTTAGEQSQAVAAGLSDGGFVITWRSDDGDQTGVFGQVYDADGVAVGTEFRANTETDFVQDAHQVVGLADGGFVVSWTSQNQDGDGLGVYAQIFDADADPAGSEFLINLGTPNAQWRPALSALPDGGFVAVWMAEESPGGNHNIHARRFDSAGAGAPFEVLVNSVTLGDQEAPVVATLVDGGFVVAWEGPDAMGSGIFARRFDADGNAVAGEFRVNTTTSQIQAEPVIAALADGGFVISWTSLHQDGDVNGVYSQRYDAAGRAYQMEIRGDLASNVLSLSGGSGRMVGGLGNDVYIVDSVGDTVVEGFWEGFDSVQCPFTYTLGDNVEALTLTGTRAINGIGNELNNNLNGNIANNVLDGRAGSDVMRGGRGNDTYIVGAGDSALEGINAGTDTVRSEVSFTLGAHLENLVLTGTGDIAGTGNGLLNRMTGNDGNNTFSAGFGNDVLSGGAGNDSLRGGVGADRLIGGLGADTFVFAFASESTVSPTGRDTLFFSKIEGDKIDLSIIDARVDQVGNQAFTFIARAGFSGVDGQLRYAASAGNTIVYGDINGDRTADFSFLIAGVPTLQATDFLL
jgi:Ca2+-binding RTX toxin-like protein